MNRLLVSKTDIGQVRKFNEDHCWCGKNNENHYLLVVCDGLGSYKGSKLASKIVTKNFVDSFLNADYKKTKIKKWFNNVVDKSKKDFLFEISKEPNYIKMSTTIILALIINEVAYIFWMGDSRCYIVSQNGSELLTRDHNLKNHLKDLNATEIIFKKYEDHLNSITNFIDCNIQNKLYGYKKSKINYNEILFLCSDGLYNFFDMDLLYSYFKINDKESHLDQIIQMALKNGSDDNISFSAYVNFK